MNKETWTEALKVPSIFFIASILAMAGALHLCVRENEARAQTRRIDNNPPRCAIVLDRFFTTTCSITGTDHSGIIEVDSDDRNWPEDNYRVDVWFKHAFANKPVVMLNVGSSDTPEATPGLLNGLMPETAGFSFAVHGYGHHQWYYIVSEGEPDSPEAPYDLLRGNTIFTTFDPDTHKITSEINTKGDIYAHNVTVDGSPVLKRDDLLLVWVVGFFGALLGGLLGKMLGAYISSSFRRRRWVRIRAWKAKQPKPAGGPHRS